MTSVELLPRIAVDKPWGRETLQAPFMGTAGCKTGEIWFDPPAMLRELLVKYIFTSENLSVQVHPSDAQTLQQGKGAQGKEECWLVIDALPGARLGIGLKQATDTATLHKAALDGSIENLMAWHPVKSGDFFYIPAGTIHAIGAGLSILEVQQNSDITYRLYDYGRVRPLHLDEGLAVALPGKYDAPRFHTALTSAAHLCLVDGPLFRLDLCSGRVSDETAQIYGNRPALLLPLDAPLHAGDVTVAPGDCAVSNDFLAVPIDAEGRFLIAQPCSPAPLGHTR